MPNSATISPRIVEALYCEALLLADEVRHAFALPPSVEAVPSSGASISQEHDRLAMSNEGLRTTTRMMHAIAWLLNHRAYFLGEIDHFQLRRSGRLSPTLRHSADAHLARLRPDVVDLVQATQRFYDRLLRLDGAWGLQEHVEHSAIERLRRRIGGQLAC